MHLLYCVCVEFVLSGRLYISVQAACKARGHWRPRRITHCYDAYHAPLLCTPLLKYTLASPSLACSLSLSLSRCVCVSVAHALTPLPAHHTCAFFAGDINAIVVGDKTNIQDNVTVHVAKHSANSSAGGPQPTIIGNNVTIGHAATLHACKIGDGCLVSSHSRDCCRSLAALCWGQRMRVMMGEGRPCSVVAAGAGGVLRTMLVGPAACC